MHVLKILAEIVGIVLVLSVIVAVIVGASIVHDEDSGNNPFQ